MACPGADCSRHPKSSILNHGAGAGLHPSPLTGEETEHGSDARQNQPALFSPDVINGRRARKPPIAQRSLGWLSRHALTNIPLLQSCLSAERITLARVMSCRRIRSSRTRASRARWSSSTRDTLRSHRFALGMTPSKRPCPRPQERTCAPGCSRYCTTSMSMMFGARPANEPTFRLTSWPRCCHSSQTRWIAYSCAISIGPWDVCPRNSARSSTQGSLGVLFHPGRCNRPRHRSQFHPDRRDQSTLLECGDQRRRRSTVMVILMLMTAKRSIMGEFTIGGWLRALGWLATAAMAACVCGMLATWLI